MATALEQILSANSFTDFSPDDAAETFGGWKSNLEVLPAAPAVMEARAEPLYGSVHNSSTDRQSSSMSPAARPTRPEPPAPCPICNSPLFWISVYDAARLNCWGCDYPPAWVMVRERWSLRSDAGSDLGPGELTWEQHPREQWTPQCDENQPLGGDALVDGEVGRGGGDGGDEMDRPRPGARQGDGYHVEYQFHERTSGGSSSKPNYDLRRLAVMTDPEMVAAAIGRIEMFESSQRMGTAANT